MTNTLFIGTSNGNASGTYTLSDAGFLSAANEQVDQRGSFSHVGGVNNVTNLYVGYTTAGNYSLSGTGLISAGTETIGYENAGFYQTGSATFTHTSGTNTVGTLQLGAENGTGYYMQSDSAQLLATKEYIGDVGVGTFTQTGGTNSTGSLWLGYSFGMTSFSMGGVYNLSGAGLLAVTGTTYLGSGIGVGATFTQTGGTSSLAMLRLGDSIAYNSKGTCNLEGGLMVVNGVAVGSGTGTFNFTGGTLQAGAATTNFGIPTQRRGHDRHQRPHDGDAKPRHHHWRDRPQFRPELARWLSPARDWLAGFDRQSEHGHQLRDESNVAGRLSAHWRHDRHAHAK